MGQSHSIKQISKECNIIDIAIRNLDCVIVQNQKNTYQINFHNLFKIQMLNCQMLKIRFDTDLTLDLSEWLLNILNARHYHEVIIDVYIDNSITALLLDNLINNTTLYKSSNLCLHIFSRLIYFDLSKTIQILKSASNLSYCDRVYFVYLEGYNQDRYTFINGECVDIFSFALRRAI